jgi:hypothetical protein
MSDERTQRETDEHLADVSDGCGCTEMWEHMSDHRDEE